LIVKETDMKTSIFNMTFVLPPMIEMTEVEKGFSPLTIWSACLPFQC
jgi:hypothetical protein